MPDTWVVALISAIVGGIAGSGLMMLWDWFKHETETARSDRAVLAAIEEDVATNLDVLRSQIEYLEQELGQVNERVADPGLRLPITELVPWTWELVRLRPPAAISDDPELLRSMSRVVGLTRQVNELARTHSNFKIMHRHLITEYPQELRALDETMLAPIGLLRDSVTGLGQSISRIAGTYRTTTLDV